MIETAEMYRERVNARERLEARVGKVPINPIRRDRTHVSIDLWMHMMNKFFQSLEKWQKRVCRK